MKNRLLDQYETAVLRFSRAVEEYSVAAGNGSSDSPKQLALEAMDAAYAARRALDAHECRHGCGGKPDESFTCLEILPSSEAQGEIIIGGSLGAYRVITRLSIRDLEQHFKRSNMSAQEAMRLVKLNLQTIACAVGINYRRRNYHLDGLSGESVLCVHVSVSGIVLDTGQELSDFGLALL